MNVNRWTRGKTVIKGKLVFGGGHPIFRIIPRLYKWGQNISVYWLDTELVWLGVERRSNRGAALGMAERGKMDFVIMGFGLLVGLATTALFAKYGL